MRRLADLSLVLLGCKASQPQPLVHRFEHADEWSKRFDDPARDAWQNPQEVVRAMRISPGMTVADIGAGTGYFEPYLARAVEGNGTVLAVDIEPEMVRHIEARAGAEHWTQVKAVLAEVGDPKLPAHGVDRILIVDTWHHIPSRERYLAKLREALAPGGLLGIVDFTMESPEGPPLAHRIAVDALLAELAQAGWRAERVAIALPNQYMVIAR
jgi:ubiquinone/menaquinone biosynthesis C-methylase UbiE